MLDLRPSCMLCSVGLALHRPHIVLSASLWPSSGEVLALTIANTLLLLALPPIDFLACSGIESDLCFAAFIFHEDIKSLPMAIVGTSFLSSTPVLGFSLES